METYVMMKPKVDAILQSMVTRSVPNGAALAEAAVISPASARKVLRGESVSLGVATKVAAVLGGANPVGKLFTSSFVNLSEDDEIEQ